MTSALLLDNVTKRFGDKVAVDQLGFAVQPGQVFGFLGPNGAGKSTTLRMILGLFRPTFGRIEVMGQAVGPQSKSQIGFLAEERGLYKHMRADEQIAYMGRLKGMTATDALQSARQLLERLGLGASQSAKVSALSKGMAQRVQLAAALVHRPPLVLLDEPFSGLDPVNQQQLENVILEVAQAGAAVLFSTHVMQHAERLCDRLALIARGAKLFEGTPAAARALLPVRLQVETDGTDLAALPGVWRAAALGNGAWELVLNRDGDPSQVLHECVRRGWTLRRFQPMEPSLHDVFLTLVGQQEHAA